MCSAVSNIQYICELQIACLNNEYKAQKIAQQYSGYHGGYHGGNHGGDHGGNLPRERTSYLVGISSSAKDS